jgi:hypothetical protein
MNLVPLAGGILLLVGVAIDLRTKRRESGWPHRVMFYLVLFLGLALVGIGVATSPVRNEPVELKLIGAPPP